jgi:hypothetical protein
VTGVPATRRRRPRRRKLGLLAALVLVALAFALGIALGEALHDNPKPGGTRTLVRTLTPVTLPAATRRGTHTTSKP